MYIRKTIGRYLKDLASKSAVPGGGSSAALGASLGAGLNTMVAHYSIDKAACKKDQLGLKRLLQKSEVICMGLQLLIDRDIVVYSKLDTVWHLPKGSKQRTLLLQKYLKDAAIVPLEICRLCEKAMDVTWGITKIGNLNLITDAGCGAHLIAGAFESAAINVKINLKYLKNKTFIKATKKKLSLYSKSIAQNKKKVLTKLEKVL